MITLGNLECAARFIPSRSTDSCLWLLQPNWIVKMRGHVTNEMVLYDVLRWVKGGGKTPYFFWSLKRSVDICCVILWQKHTLSELFRDIVSIRLRSVVLSTHGNVWYCYVLKNHVQGLFGFYTHIMDMEWNGTQWSFLLSGEASSFWKTKYMNRLRDYVWEVARE